MKVFAQDVRQFAPINSAALGCWTGKLPVLEIDSYALEILEKCAKGTCYAVYLCQRIFCKVVKFFSNFIGI